MFYRDSADVNYSFRLNEREEHDNMASRFEIKSAFEDSEISSRYLKFNSVYL
jgi:hypothetical protein